MLNRAAQSLLAFAVAVFAAQVSAEKISDARSCRAGNDSKPSSLGADGWAAVDGPVTGGCGAVPARVFDVHTRAQLVDALTKGHFNGQEKKLDHHSKIVYVHGTIDLNVDDANIPLREEDYMRICGYTAHATFYGGDGFFEAYKAAYDPNDWIKQSLDPVDNRPPALTGPLEEARLCFQRKQAERVMIDVGSNTSIIGIGQDARIKNGGLRIGYLNQNDPNDPENYRSENVVVRNVTFSDAFDMFPSWDPKDSFSITITNTGGCQAVFENENVGPHKCVFRGGRWNTEYDSIQVMNAAAVWIDHNSFSDEPRFDTQFPPVFAAPFNEATQKVAHHDGHVDVTLLGTKVTISNNHFLRHDKGNLLGGNDIAGLVPGYGPGVIDVTFHGNYYQDMIQRMPRVRFGRVHVYNNVFDANRLTTAEYRLGDTWATGTAAKLVTENNLFDILNNNLTIPRIINYASTVANRDICVNAGFSLAECGTYYFDAGTWITMRTATTSATTLFDAFTALSNIQDDSPSNAPLMNAVAFWLPSYDYALAPVSTPEERAALRSRVVNGAGAGKL
jgi:pectate lyase